MRTLYQLKAMGSIDEYAEARPFTSKQVFASLKEAEDHETDFVESLLSKVEASTIRVWIVELELVAEGNRVEVEVSQ